MRKSLIRTVLLIAAVLILFSACSSKQVYNIAEAGSWQDGTYTEKTKGRNGSYTVVLTIENGFITAIEADESRETPERGGRAISIMIPKMIEKQSYDVDIVSGATITSESLEKAVAEILEKASSPTL